MLEYKLTESWNEVRQIIVFGYGRQARKIVEKISDDFEIVTIVDNDRNKWNMLTKENIQIVSFEEALPLLKQYKIIVTAMGANYNEIKRQLCSIGLKEFIDFLQHEVFITEWYYRNKQQVRLLKTDIFVTPYCTLNCVKCASFIPYWKAKKHVDINNLKETINLFFECVDFVYSMDFYGGEPLLYNELGELILYVNNRYGSKIGYLGIITNGTIIPNKELLEIMQKCNVGVSISDYSNAIDYNGKVDLLCEVLSENQIIYTRNKDMIWKNLGFPNASCNYEGESADIHRMECNTTCHGLCGDKKLYFCAIALAAQLGELYSVTENDYLDMTRICQKSEVLEFSVGVCKQTPYVGICNVCRGFGIDNDEAISAAEQIDK